MVTLEYMIIERLAGAAGGCSRVAMSRWDGDLAIWKATWRKSHRILGGATDKGQETISLPLENRRCPLRRCRMILVVLGEDRAKGFLGPKFRSADLSQTESVPI